MSNSALDGYLDMELLRFTTAGSVDDGKSTLIGRLLYDSKAIFDDQLDAVEKASKKAGNENINLALLTDGLKAEREQGITIDVAYRYFATPRRKFIIADTPGHIEYTRNMVTGASTANLAIILIDARNGVVEQTRRHSYIASLLQIPHVVICINKMDLVDFSQQRFEEIKSEYEIVSSKLSLRNVNYIPISAKNGDNVVHKSLNMEWHTGDSLINFLETVPLNREVDYKNPRFPVQYVVRPQTDEFHDYRAYAGRIAGGQFSQGDKVVVLPSRATSTIAKIHQMDQELKSAHAPLSVSIVLEDDIDISRGDMIVSGEKLPHQAQEIEVMLCWMSTTPFVAARKYLLQHTVSEAKCLIKEVMYKINMHTLEKETENKSIEVNDICCVSLKITKPIYYDSYNHNKITGSLILIDEATNVTIAAGMII